MTQLVPNLVSVVIPAYNATWCVARAIDSVLAQHYREFEILVVDDGSTDTTAQVVASYGAQVRLLQQPNGGLSSARNLGMRHARGEWIAFLDADDWWLPEKLARQVACMREFPTLGFCSTATRVEDPQGRELHVWRCPTFMGSALETIFRVNAAVAGSGSSVLVRVEVLRTAGEFDTELRSLEDIDMWMRLSAITEYRCLPDVLSVILKRPDSMSRHLDTMRASAIRVMRKNRRLLPQAQQGAFWRHAFAGVLADYAKWAFRAGRGAQGVRDVVHGLLVSPFGRGRLLLGILAAGLSGKLRAAPPAMEQGGAHG